MSRAPLPAAGLAVAAGVVSALFLAPPTPELLAGFADPAAAEQWPIEDEGARAALASVAADGLPSEEELRADHFRLFVGRGRGLARPHESDHVDSRHPLSGDETFDGRGSCVWLGLESPELDRVPDDHIGLELAFVAELADRILQSDGDRQLRILLGQFMAHHLDRFAEAVLADVEKNARTSVYRALPALTRSVLAEAREMGVRPFPLL